MNLGSISDQCGPVYRLYKFFNCYNLSRLAVVMDTSSRGPDTQLIIHSFTDLAADQTRLTAATSTAEVTSARVLRCRLLCGCRRVNMDSTNIRPYESEPEETCADLELDSDDDSNTLNTLRRTGTKTGMAQIECQTTTMLTLIVHFLVVVFHSLAANSKPIHYHNREKRIGENVTSWKPGTEPRNVMTPRNGRHLIHVAVTDEWQYLPGLNFRPICHLLNENVWDVFTRQLVHTIRPPTNTDELWTRVESDRQEIPHPTYALTPMTPVFLPNIHYHITLPTPHYLGVACSLHYSVTYTCISLNEEHLQHPYNEQHSPKTKYWTRGEAKSRMWSRLPLLSVLWSGLWLWSRLWRVLWSALRLKSGLWSRLQNTDGKIERLMERLRKIDGKSEDWWIGGREDHEKLVIEAAEHLPVRLTTRNDGFRARRVEPKIAEPIQVEPKNASRPLSPEKYQVLVRAGYERGLYVAQLHKPNGVVRNGTTKSFKPLPFSRGTGATVAERLACLPPSKANRVQSPAVSPDSRQWGLCRTMPLVGGFPRGSPASPAPAFRCCSIFTSITLIGSQDLAVKSRPNLFTHSFKGDHIFLI
ncbi:hypothetical protein PR048_016207 [Dryococelus australis]|uniref:Uncharacterized protein n=1 Tax=Dryococelus australis TaxID=614101 RepID=A0ABQ9HJI7_9NEOP|nr:hypothetical protein PR048_016207 [Dryococelus australis]